MAKQAEVMEAWVAAATEAKRLRGAATAHQPMDGVRSTAGLPEPVARHLAAKAAEEARIEAETARYREQERRDREADRVAEDEHYRGIAL